MEPVQQTPPTTATAGVTWFGPRLEIRERDIAAEAWHLKLDKPAEVRLRLQRRAPENLRHHAQRAVTRFIVLVAADMTAFAVLRALGWPHQDALDLIHKQRPVTMAGICYRDDAEVALKALGWTK